MVNIHLDLSLIDLLSIFSSGCVILIQWFLWVLSQQSSFCLVMKCFPLVFWCRFEYKIVLFHYVIITSKRFINCASNSLDRSVREKTLKGRQIDSELK